MDAIRLSIRNKMIDMDIIPSETCSSEKVFCRPPEVCRLNVSFWSIINRTVGLGVNVPNISSHGIHIVNSYFDSEEYDSVLDFLDVGYADSEWYGRFIQGSDLVKLLPEDIYFDLLVFVAQNWKSMFAGTTMEHIPLVKCVSAGGVLAYMSVFDATMADERLCMLPDEEYAQLIISWNNDYFSTVSRMTFIPLSMQKGLRLFSKRTAIMEWLEKYVGMKVLTLHEYTLTVVKALRDKCLVLAFTRFICQLHNEEHMPDWGVRNICSLLPIVDSLGCVVTRRSVVLVPSKGSKWADLLGENPWRDQSYVELGDDYMSENTSGENFSEGLFLSFARTYLQASDVPLLLPPDAGFPAASSSLTGENALLLLDWVDNLNKRGTGLPKQFSNCIMFGNWLKTLVGYRSPSQSFLLNEEWSCLFQAEISFLNVPIIDQEYYLNKISDYKEVLGSIGVKFEFAEAMAYVGKCFISTVISSTTGERVLPLLRFIRILRKEHMPTDHLVRSIRDCAWLKTCLGYKSPPKSFLYTSEWALPSEISNLSFVDINFYGAEICDYKYELEKLGVHVRLKQEYKVIVENIKMPIGPVTSGAAILLLRCIRNTKPCRNLIQALKKGQWLKTNAGFRAPRETFLLAPEWKCLIKVSETVPLLDLSFYGDEILNYQDELMKIGVVVSLEQASSSITCYLKRLLLTYSLTKEIRIALLSCYKDINDEGKTFPPDILMFLQTEKWLHTTKGFRSPKNCVLFDSSWEAVIPVANLPFIDDSETINGTGKEIYNYKKELKALGVSVDINHGADFVMSCLSVAVSRNAREISDQNVDGLTNADPLLLVGLTLVALLKCMQRSENPRSFAECIRKMQIKSLLGYRYADQCILYDGTWSSYLHREDGPFIDEEFYDPEILFYRTELRQIGVIVDVGYGCSLLAQDLKHFSRCDTITRIYKYLELFKWDPINKGESWIWIPSGRNSGKWVRPADCVLHDRNGLFCMHFSVLDKYYEKDLLRFFSNVLGVRHAPRVLDHCNLWRSWECTTFDVTPASCSFFWEFIGHRWDATRNKLLSGSVTRVPVLCGGKIILQKVEDVFVPDDLLLKHLFDQTLSETIFVWYPLGLSFASRPKMDAIYQSLGVRPISKAVKKDDVFLNMNHHQAVDVTHTVLRPGLLRIILAFLGNPALEISSDNRHQLVSYLLSMKVLEMTEPINVSYQIKVSLGRIVTVKGRRMFRWERADRKLYVQKSDRVGKVTRMELAASFGEEISVALLYERADLIPSLTELLKIGFLVNFEKDEVDFLLKSKNLQLFSEDVDFLAGAFPFEDDQCY